VKKEDQEAIERIRRGEPRAFEGILRRYEERIYNFGLRMCGAVEDARDLLQETFMTAFTYIGRFRGEADLSTWLYKIASSICIKRKRRGKFEPKYELSLEDLVGEEVSSAPGRAPLLQSTARGGRSVVGSVPTPDDTVLRREVRELISRALQVLPTKYRIVLVLRDMEGLSAQEVGKVLGLSNEAVKSRLHRARAFMKEQLRGVMQ